MCWSPLTKKKFYRMSLQGSQLCNDIQRPFLLIFRRHGNRDVWERGFALACDYLSNHLQIFQIVWQNFKNHHEIFQIECIVCRRSHTFPVCLEDFQSVLQFSRLSGQYPDQLWKYSKFYLNMSIFQGTYFFDIMKVAMLSFHIKGVTS